MRETNRERGEKERGRRRIRSGNSIDVARTNAIRRRTLTSFATRQFDVHGPKDKKPPLFVLNFYPTTLNLPSTFNPVHLFFPFNCFSSKRSHLLPSRTHPPMHAHSSQKASSKATRDTKRREESRRGIER